MILENYESVAERIEKFWNHYLGIGRIDTELVYQDGTRYIVKAFGYRETTDLVPFATGYAEEIRSNTNRHPIENAETSAIGRMLTCSRHQQILRWHRPAIVGGNEKLSKQALCCASHG
jgi:hypothetical protein